MLSSCVSASGGVTGKYSNIVMVLYYALCGADPPLLTSRQGMITENMFFGMSYTRAQANLRQQHVRARVLMAWPHSLSD